MITVTTPSTVNAITPLTEGTSNQAVISTAIPNEGFTNALNTQIGLAVTPMSPESTALITAQTALLNATNATAETTTLSTQQPTVLVDTSADNLPILNGSETTMSAQDEAVLSNVNDTLKFITASTKLSDTLPNGQSVRLQTANLLTPITSQTVQPTVNQATTNIPVNTPTTVLAQQVMPVQVGTATVKTEQTDIDVTDILLNVENVLKEQTAQKPVVTTQAQVQTPITQITPEKPTVTTQTQTATPEQPVVAMPQQIQMPVTQTGTSEKIAVTTQNQMFVTQTTTDEKSNATTQTLVAPTAIPEKLVATTPAQTQTLVAQAKAAEKPVVVTQNQMPVAQTEALEKPVITTMQAQTERTGTNFSEIPQLMVSSTIQQPVNKDENKITDENIQTTSTLLTDITASVESKNVVSKTVAESEIPKSETPKTDDVDNKQDIQVTEQAITPIVTAQAAPIEIEAEPTNRETTTVPEDKPTLTPAKNLLADVLASRNNNSDTTSGDKKGSDTPANAMFQNENVFTTNADNKQNTFEAKSFASLLENEKSDVTMTNATTQTTDKSAPQVMAAVNKLAETVKSEVPALTRPLSHPNWNDDLGERIVWMNNRNISSAEIRMNPQHMGPITVRIDMNQDQATIAFTAQNAEVRTALESAIPKLRDMLSSQNVNLADVNVSQQSSTNSDSNRSQQQAAQMATDASANGQGSNRQNQEIETDANGNTVRDANTNGEGVTVDEFANEQVLQDNGTNGLLSLFA